MIAFVVAILTALASTGDVADRVGRLPDVQGEHTATFVDHVAAAQVAGWLAGVRPALLLAFAWHESRFTPDYVQPEARGNVSCGVMTPEPIAPPCPRQTLVEQYLAGATHIRVWLAAARGDERLALLGVAGGYHLIAACRDANPRPRGCAFPEQMLALAAKIEGP